MQVDSGEKDQHRNRLQKQTEARPSLHVDARVECVNRRRRSEGDDTHLSSVETLPLCITKVKTEALTCMQQVAT